MSPLHVTIYLSHLIIKFIIFQLSETTNQDFFFVVFAADPFPISVICNEANPVQADC